MFCIFVMFVIRDDFINFADNKVFADFSFAIDWIVPQQRYYFFADGFEFLIGGVQFLYFFCVILE